MRIEESWILNSVRCCTHVIIQLSQIIQNNQLEFVQLITYKAGVKIKTFGSVPSMFMMVTKLSLRVIVTDPYKV